MGAWAGGGWISCIVSHTSDLSLGRFNTKNIFFFLQEIVRCVWYEFEVFPTNSRYLEIVKKWCGENIFKMMPNYVYKKSHIWKKDFNEIIQNIYEKLFEKIIFKSQSFQHQEHFSSLKLWDEYVDDTGWSLFKFFYLFIYSI